MPLQSGEQIGPYRIESRLGTGGMATVYKAYHEKLDRNVAIKLMHPSMLEDENFRQRFEREARIIARLEHPNIVSVYDFSEHEAEPYLVMKFVDGKTLKRILAERVLTMDEVRQIMMPLGAALSYAHERGVLHRDIKPSNIMIGNSGHAYLTDFGLARLAQAGESTLSTDTLLGTPNYISPEQARGDKEIDGRADVYSLGVVLYELIVGQVPFEGDSAYSIVHDHIYAEPPPPRSINPDVPEAVEAVILKSLSKKAADRYPTPAALVTALNDALEAPESGAFEASRAENRDAMPKPKSQSATPPQPPQPPEVIPAPFGSGERSFEEHIENFGKRMEEWGHTIERKFENMDDEAHKHWKPGKVWGQNLEGQWGWYRQEDLDAISRMDLSEEEKIRLHVQKKIEERRGLMIHGFIFVVMHIFFLSLWDGTGFPWPLIIFFGWGIGMFAHFMEYYNNYGAGRDRKEALIQREIERERERLNRMSEKPKNTYDDAVDQIRLTGDGELTDSFVEEWDAENKRKRR